MDKSNWHLRIAITSTVMLMSFATALVIPQFASPKPALREISVPYHVTVSESMLYAKCAESPADENALTLASIDAEQAIAVEIYSRDAAASLPHVKLNTAPEKNCIHLNTGYTAHKAFADVTFGPTPKAVCKQAEAVALKVE